jgi:tetratricopeptide (TPR) repeat protein
MTYRLLVDLADDGRVLITSYRNEFPNGEAGDPYAMAWPLDADALEELRWYLEDYLRVPFGVYESRGAETATQLRSWGEAIFGAVFGLDPTRDSYQRIGASTNELQVLFCSGSSKWLGLPWELIKDPAGKLPLALVAAGLDRTLPTADREASFEVGGERLRVLMVISRPAGGEDVDFQMVARPLLDRLQAVRGAVDLVVLRPPTLGALADTLAEARAAGKPFQIVHFDGHGELTGHRSAGVASSGMSQATTQEGVLIFQGAEGGPDRVSASRVAQVLSAARVPVVVLNSCQSGAVGKDLETAVATRLLRGGAASVVGMAYNVYAVAAAEFMTAFYDQLFAGETVSAAVTAGRRQLYNHNARPSPKGDLPLSDWMVPVHYLRREVSFTSLITTRPSSEPSLEEALTSLRDARSKADGGALAAVGAFTGRDGLLFELEAAARLQHVIVLHGSAGTGKTELAKAFGRWWQDTGGVDQPEWVFWHSFEPGAASFGLSGVINDIGSKVYGPEFARLKEAERIEVIEEFLREQRVLLIWDNFESIRSLPDPTAPSLALDETGCRQLRDFLHRLAASGRSTVLITSRTTETWLDKDSHAGIASGMRRVEVAGLLPPEAVDYANELLTPYPAAIPRRTKRAFGELMQWLDGHPLSMRLILPYLGSTEPERLLNGLQGITVLPGWENSQLDRTGSLSASLSYSYTCLGLAVQRLLSAVCLFHTVADANVLAMFSSVTSVPERFRQATKETWFDALGAASVAGLLTDMGRGMYRIHPALPAYLAMRWRDDEGAGYESQRAAATGALLSAYADRGKWLREQITSGDAELANTIIDLQQHTMGHLLGYALEQRQWDEAQSIAQPLVDFWDSRGWYTDADALTDRIRLAVEASTGVPPPMNSPAGSLWLHFISAQAVRQGNMGDLDAAEQICRLILTILQAQRASTLAQQVAAVHHMLGVIAHRRGRLDEAEELYRQSLALNMELGDRLAMARSYHQLGMVAQHRGRLDEAEEWYSQALAIEEELGLRPAMARTSNQLGMVAQVRGRLDEAESWLSRSLAIEVDLGNKPGMASSYHQVGMVVQESGRLDEAEKWYTRSLVIEEELRNRPGMAISYHMLGSIAFLRKRLNDAENWYNRAIAIGEEIGDRRGTANSYHELGLVAQERERLDEAADWYSRSLAIKEEFGDQPGLALTYSQLGVLAEAQHNLALALDWCIRCVALFDDVPHPGAGTGAEQLARLSHQLGIGTLETYWQQVTSHQLPEAVRTYVRTYRPDNI